ncbi:MAG: MFS transporter, partial [Clostridia bacterium]|nr:MFS transporter [Clostridia bacterium]
METTQKKGLYRWVVLAVLVLAFTTTFFSRFIWSPLLSTAAGDMNMNMAQAGSLMSAFYFGYLVLQIPAGIIADKVRTVRPWLAGFVLLVGVMTFLMQYATDYVSGYAIRFIGGFFGGMIMALCARLLSNYFAGPERGIAFGILLASPSMGTLLANQIGPRILVASGWRSAFAVCAYIIAAVAVLVMLVIKEPKVEKVAAPAANAPKSSLLDGVKNYFSNVQIVILSVAGFLFMAVPPGYSTWANKFMTGGCALTPAEAGNIVTVYAIFSIVGSMSSGFIGKKF